MPYTHACWVGSVSQITVSQLLLAIVSFKFAIFTKHCFASSSSSPCHDSIFFLLVVVLFFFFVLYHIWSSFEVLLHGWLAGLVDRPVGCLPVMTRFHFYWLSSLSSYNLTIRTHTNTHTLLCTLFTSRKANLFYSLKFGVLVFGSESVNSAALSSFIFLIFHAVCSLFFFFGPGCVQLYRRFSSFALLLLDLFEFIPLTRSFCCPPLFLAPRADYLSFSRTNNICVNEKWFPNQ